MTANVRIMSWGMPLLYCGPAFDLPGHRKAVGLLCVCLDGAMEIRTVADDGEERTTTCGSAYIEPGVMHAIRFGSEKVACLYVEGDNAHLGSLLAGMTPLGGGLHVDHPRRAAIVEALAGRDALSAGRRDRIAGAFGLSALLLGDRDPRIARVMAAILSEPGRPHRATALARQVGLSESRLRHAFRHAPGLSLKRFRLWARMGASLRLIGDGANLTVAAHEAGFSSSAHFSTAYRALFGLKPSAVVRANPMLASSRQAHGVRGLERPS